MSHGKVLPAHRFQGRLQWEIRSNIVLGRWHFFVSGCSIVVILVYQEQKQVWFLPNFPCSHTHHALWLGSGEGGSSFQDLISDFIENNKFIHSSQHKFHEQWSCETQLASRVHNLHINLGTNVPSDTIFHDFAKAFDQIPPKTNA